MITPHSIDLEPGKQPPDRRIYSLTQRELDVLRDYLESSLAKGWIRPSKNPAAAPILFVPKKDGTLRLCVDYRGLNAVTIKNKHPLPLISETLARLAGACVFTQFDLRHAYHRIRVKPGHEQRTAFKTRYGTYEYLVMPFGLANAPATFQGYINRALAGMIDVFVVAYPYDILIYSKDHTRHYQHVLAVLQRLREFRLYVKLSKSAFHVDTVHFLGFIITSQVFPWSRIGSPR